MVKTVSGAKNTTVLPQPWDEGAEAEVAELARRIGPSTGVANVSRRPTAAREARSRSPMQYRWNWFTRPASGSAAVTGELAHRERAGQCRVSLPDCVLEIRCERVSGQVVEGGSSR
jgi:hypothetical protein